MEAIQLQEVIEKGFRDLRAELGEKFGKIDGRFEQIDRRFDQIDGRFEQIDGRFEQINGRFEQIDGRFVEIEGRFERVDNDIAEIRRDLKRVGDNAHLARVEIEALRHDLTIFDEEDSTPLGKRVSALEVRVEKLERKRTPKK